MKHVAIKDAWAACSKIHDKRRRLYAEGNKLHDEGDKLYDEASKLPDAIHKRYIDAVIEKYGYKAVINWETGEITTL